MSNIKEWLSGTRQTVIWVEYETYARRVFANSPPDWYRDSARFASVISQAQDVLSSHCISIDVLAPFLSSLEDLAVGGDAEQIIESFNTDEAAEFIDNTLDALLHRFGAELDLFLAIKAPADLLRRNEGSGPPSFDDLDDVATALSNLLRPLAAKPLAGILLHKEGQLSFTMDEVDAYEPIVSAAQHYDWCTAVSFHDVSPDAIPEAGLDVDLVLLPQVALELVPNDAGRPRFGGGLTSAFWGGTGIAMDGASGHLLHGHIPPTANPEAVLSLLAALS